MTVFEEIAPWLGGILEGNFPSREFIIDLEHMPSEAKSENAAIMSSPNDLAVTLMSGRVKHTDFKTLYARFDFNDTGERIGNEAFFETLKTAIARKNLNGGLPASPGTRQWRSVECTSAAYPSGRADNEDTAVYQITLRLVYIEGV
ncbi:MAG: hypothetical protein LBI91_01205 [Spirochaetaceae bacterium]|jgi:hypothetical protein|nr:hypothetical protein [Spirochaetaceae bacterium]